ncbi:hypothetical protein GALMADRAFT_257166 [Galerina marginata CBS 339.88]|uniref:Uncharacterized protein n=1 Tax=Galerina marginata (strain CBS 339.88) TaxID=685588 RepID=A0A067SNX9_GALM3|nr:hypothetical protein GALMADRAFT_257166 [Galerina marginata CBS 339.88]
MSPDGFLENVNGLSHSSNWHSIRPWAPSLSLAVREITSVSATFILSSTFDAEFDPSLASLGLRAAEDEPEHAFNGNSTAPLSAERKPNSVIADALAKGLSVNVNGSAWPRAFIRIDDQLDEAVIIIYALMPGRQYDIELGLASAGQPSLARHQVTTEDDSDHDTAEIHTDPESPTPDNSTSSDPHSTPSTSPSRTVPGTPPNAVPQITLEDRLNQLQHTLSTVNAERETIVSSLKSARRDAQKAESALRSEIDTLKRTSEKNAAGELRGKQKVLALQEALKRAQNSTKEMEEMADELESLVPGLNAQKGEKENDHGKIKSEADRVRKDREDVEEKERKRLEAMRAELAGLTNKLEKLGGKKEKLETTIIPDLEDRLRETANEIEAEEQELLRLEAEDHQAQIQAESQRTMNGQQPVESNSPSYVPLQRVRHHSHGDKQAPIGRPPAPIQRPPHVDVTGTAANSNSNPVLPQSASSPLWSPSAAQRQHQPHSHVPHSAQNTHIPHSHSFHGHGTQNHSTPTLLTNHRRSSQKSNSMTISTASTPSISNPASTSLSSILTGSTTSSPASSSLTSSPTRTSPGISAAMSTLSSRAPAFEPSRSLGPIKSINGTSHFQGHGGPNTTTSSSRFPQPASPVAMHTQRPSGSFVGTARPMAVSGSKNGAHGHAYWAETHGHGQAPSGFDRSR